MLHPEPRQPDRLAGFLCRKPGTGHAATDCKQLWGENVSPWNREASAGS